MKIIVEQKDNEIEAVLKFYETEDIIIFRIQVKSKYLKPTLLGENKVYFNNDILVVFEELSFRSFPIISSERSYVDVIFLNPKLEESYYQNGEWLWNK